MTGLLGELDFLVGLQLDETCVVVQLKIDLFIIIYYWTQSINIHFIWPIRLETVETEATDIAARQVQMEISHADQYRSKSVTQNVLQCVG